MKNLKKTSADLYERGQGMNKNKIIIFYMPVIHRGYLNFIEKYTGIREIGILDEDLIAEGDYLKKEI